MQFNTLLTTLERYLNDLLGSVIPGGVFILSIWFINESSNWGLDFPDSETSWQMLAWGVAAFIIGHILSQLYQWLSFLLHWVLFLGVHLLKKLGIGKSISAEGHTSRSKSERAFGEWVHVQIGQPSEFSLGASELRGIAHAMNQMGSELSTRFRFLNLLFSGTGTALLFAGLIGLHRYGVDIKEGVVPVQGLLQICSWAAICVPILLYPRAHYFNRLANETPFQSALGTIFSDKKNLEGVRKLIAAGLSAGNEAPVSGAISINGEVDDKE